MPPRPLIGKLHELCSERSSGEAVIDVVLELLRLGVTFSTEPFVMPPRHGKSSDDDGRHDCKDNSRPGSRGHRFMVTKPPRSSPESVRASPNVGVSVTCGFIEERGEADDG
jgi:hypothetical protein